MRRKAALCGGRKCRAESTKRSSPCDGMTAGEVEGRTVQKIIVDLVEGRTMQMITAGLV